MIKQNCIKNVYTLICLAVILGLAGCNQQGSNDKTGRRAETATAPITTSRTEPGTGPAAAMPGEKTEKAGDFIDDSAITMRVKSALSNEPMLKDADINVTTNDGIVQLNGSVPSEQAMSRAVEVASSQKNVKTVQSALTVKPSIAK
ncbi:MAG: BON domain-containing protein [Methylobacter sp.]